jgi:enterochelin esterase family protein
MPSELALPAESPRLAALRREIDAGDARAPSRFWDEMAERGTPLAEPIPDDVPKGRVEAHRFESEILGNERRVWVYTPPGYEGFDGCRLLLVFDGWDYLHINRTPTVLDNLLAAGKIPPTVAVLFDSVGTFAGRTHELRLNPAFSDCVTRELMPWLAARYRFTADPACRVIGGTSLGGLAAAFVALRSPSLFGNVLCQSGAFQYGRPGETEHEAIARMVAAEPRKPLRFWLDAGLLEGLVAGSVVRVDQNPGICVATRHLRTVLEAKGYEVHHKEFSGAHDFAGWRGTLPEGLVTLIGSGTA